MSSVPEVSIERLGRISLAILAVLVILSCSIDDPFGIMAGYRATQQAYGSTQWVMIRATETGYEADDLVLQKMIASIQQFKQIPIEGIVIGLLKNQRVDPKGMMLLIEAAFPLKITLHKAIDLSVDVDADIRWLNRFTQVDTILTSGGAIRAADGVQEILRMKSLFEGQIMAAGKITPDVLPSLHTQLGLQWYHGRAIV